MSETVSLAADVVGAPFALAHDQAAARKPLRRPSRPLVLGVASALHLGLVCVVQAEFRHQRTDIVEPDVVMTALVELPSAAPKTAPEPPKPSPPRAAPLQAPVHTPLAPADAPFVLAAAQTPPATPAAAQAPAPAPASEGSPSPTVRPPSADADYASSCRVAYPPLSRSMREHGRVVLNVLVGDDGRSKRVELLRSSGSPRLDGAAREAMQRCRFRPGTVNGVAHEMAYEAPVDFVLR